MTFQFYAALSVSPSAIRKTFTKLAEEYGSISPVKNIMFTPISNGDGSHSEIKQLVDRHDLNIMFDSGGYEVQVGNKTFDELYAYLLNFYQDNRWGHRYVLPDNVPLSQDTPAEVEQKVKETIDTTRLCFRRLPDDVQNNAVAVVQGHTKTQISRCLDAYADLDGLQHVGFGSFATSGISNGVNMLTKEAYNNLEWAVSRAHEEGMTVHAFGIGGPTSLPLLYEAGVDSFDTTSWMRSGGYGNVFFPFKSRFNVSHRTNRSGKVLTSEELPHLMAETGHSCPFCESITQLRDSRWNRIIHNLIVLHEMSDRIDDLSRDQILENMDTDSKYRRRLENLDTRASTSGD